MAAKHKNRSLLQCEDSAYYTNTIGIVVDWVIFIVGLPEVSLACYALLCLLKKNRVAPIFAINLFVSDFIQIAITIVFIISRFFKATFFPFVAARCIARLLVRLGLTSSLGFMLLISAERYLMVAHPVWYRTKSTANLCILVSICMWTLSAVYSVLDYILFHTRFSLFLFSIICLVPAPFLLGLFIATWKALNKSEAMRRQKRNKRKVLGALSLVLGTYIVLFLPFSFRNLYYSLKRDSATDAEDSVRDLSLVLTSALVYLSPLFDSFIYIFIRSDIRDTVDAFPCCKVPLMKLKELQDKLTANSQAGTTS